MTGLPLAPRCQRLLCCDIAPAALAARPELTKLAEHTEPDFIAETYLPGHGQPISVAAAEGLLDGDRQPSGMRQDGATKGQTWPSQRPRWETGGGGEGEVVVVGG